MSTLVSCFLQFKKHQISINPEPFDFTRGLEFVERHTPGFRPRGEWVDWGAKKSHDAVHEGF